MRKLLVATLALAALASPAFAAKAKQPAHMPRSDTAAFYRPNTVVVDGQVVGADPDINIRSQLMRDAHVRDY